MILKYLIPFDRFVVDSPLSSQEARRRIEASLQTIFEARTSAGYGPTVR
ncbi:hypothetical protein ABAC460_11185 [Asticcacaulis sp. AC460]|nr:hypothetical protein [Asticcacaulis sp. AC460]ESQ89858.1 hypothetical protein ABAC460_11185 [Asticcacaulis sp. AC460]